MDIPVVVDRRPSGLDTVQRLHNEIGVLISKLQTPKQDPGTCYFLDKLPREIRNMIYKPLVVVGKIGVKRKGSLEQFDMRYRYMRPVKAYLHLILVCRQVYSEAWELFLSKNSFVVPAAYSTDTVDPFRYIPRGLDPKISHEYLRSVSVSIDGGNAPMLFPQAFDEDTCQSFGRGFHYDHTDDYVEQYHSVSLEKQNNFFFELMLAVLRGPPKLRKLQINLEKANCAVGCHRLVQYLFARNISKGDKHFWLKNNNRDSFKSLDFLGTVSDEERRCILSVFPSSFHEKITFHGRFDSFDKRWDPTVEVFVMEEGEGKTSDAT